MFSKEELELILKFLENYAYGIPLTYSESMELQEMLDVVKLVIDAYVNPQKYGFFEVVE